MLFDKRVNKYYKKYALFFIIGIIALLLVDYFQLKRPDIVGDVIDGLKDKTLTKDSLNSYIIDLLIIGIVMFVGRFLWRICIFGNGVRIECDLRNELFMNMQKLSTNFFNQNKTGELMALYTNDLSVIRRAFGAGTMMFVDAICLGMMALVKMFRLNWLLSVVSLALLVVITFICKIIGKRIKKATNENFEAYGELSDFVSEDFYGISVVKAFVKEKLQVNRFKPLNKNNNDTCLNIVKNSTFLDVFITFTLSTINLLIILYGSYLISKKQDLFSLGDLIKFMAYFETLVWPVQAFGRLIDLRNQGKASLDRLNIIFNEDIEINDDLVLKDFDSRIPLKGSIEYKNLSFNYPNSKNIVLNNISFKINEGEFIGIIGKTGSGKSTLLDLLLRIYNVKEDSILLDGIDIMHLPLKYVRDNISYVPQDNFLFGKSIKENIAFSDREITKDVKEYGILSDIDKDISEFTDGYDTILGERGVTVSGGQKQRISIARSLYKDSSILILDDSLSAVDSITEKNIIDNLRKIRNGKTTIIIAHRISTLMMLDKIMVVENGNITGFDTHDNLIKNNKYYESEVKLQKLQTNGELYEE